MWGVEAGSAIRRQDGKLGEVVELRFFFDLTSSWLCHRVMIFEDFY